MSNLTGPFLPASRASTLDIGMAKARRANEVSGDLLRSSDGIVLVVGLLGLMISFDKVETVFQQNKQPSHDLTATNPILGNGWGKIALASETKLQSFPHNWSAIQGEAPRHSHRGYHNLRVRMVNQQVGFHPYKRVSFTRIL